MSFEIQEVSVAVEGRLLLDRLNLSISGRRTLVVGCNGSGKSTFLRLLNGLQLPSSGRVLVDGLSTRRHGSQVRRRVGFVFQNPQNQTVMPHVHEDLSFGLKNLGVSPVAAAARITEVLQQLGIEALRERQVHSLSGGEMQLVALAGVLVMEPETVVLDEPLTYLDLVNQRRFQKIIDGLEQRVIMVSHQLELAKGFDRALLLEGGKLAADDTPATIYEEYMRRCQQQTL